MDRIDVSSLARSLDERGRMMRICVLGAASSNHVLQRAAVFRDFGHDVNLITPTAASETAGLQTVACARPNRGGIMGKVQWLASIIAAVRGAKADVYHAHYAAELTTWAAGFLGKRPLVITVMGGDVLFDEQGSLGPVGRWLTRRVLKAADLVTVKSPLLGDVVAGFGVARERIIDVVWGVDRRVFKPDPNGAKARREAWGVALDAKVLFSPRMLKPLYNQVLMVEALAEIVTRVPRAVLVLSMFQEDAAWREKVAIRAAELGMTDKVKFAPAVNAVDMAASYSAADVVLSLPPSDGTPQSVMEAMACGVPVVMTDLERFKPLFTHQQTGWFTKLERVAVAGGALSLLQDAALHARVCENAMALVADKADFEVQARAVEKRLNQLTGQA